MPAIHSTLIQKMHQIITDHFLYPMDKIRAFTGNLQCLSMGEIATFGQTATCQFSSPSIEPRRKAIFKTCITAIAAHLFLNLRNNSNVRDSPRAPRHLPRTSIYSSGPYHYHNRLSLPLSWAMGDNVRSATPVPRTGQA